MYGLYLSRSVYLGNRRFTVTVPKPLYFLPFLFEAGKTDGPTQSTHRMYFAGGAPRVLAAGAGRARARSPSPSPVIAAVTTSWLSRIGGGTGGAGAVISQEIRGAPAVRSLAVSAQHRQDGWWGRGGGGRGNGPSARTDATTAVQTTTTNKRPEQRRRRRNEESSPPPHNNNGNPPRPRFQQFGRAGGEGSKVAEALYEDFGLGCGSLKEYSPEAADERRAALKRLAGQIGMGARAVADMVEQEPRIAELEAESVSARLAWLKDRLRLGDEQLKSLVHRRPSVLCRSVEDGMEPKVRCNQQRK